MAVARVTEIIAGSKKSFDDAIEQGIARASKTLKNLEGAWVPDQKLVVVRLGKTDDAERPALVEALAEIVALYPET